MSFFSTILVQPAVAHKILIPIVSTPQIRHYAARKGTRARKEKAKVKVEVQKVGFIPHNQRDKEKMLKNRQLRKFNDSTKLNPVDNVYPMKYYRWIVYPFAEAVRAHRETHHPDIYNKPEANLHVSIELNMQGEKKNRFVDNFKRIVGIQHKFDHGEERSILAFAKTTEDQEMAVQGGVNLAGGIELIKQIQNGQVNLNDFKYVIAHPDILPELVVLRGIMKKRFPNPKTGTLDVDLKKVADRLLHGINYAAQKDEYEKDFGLIDTVIGTLNMDESHLEENFKELIRDVYSQKPKREGSFISRCLLSSPPSQEILKVDHEIYLKDLLSAPEDKIQEEEERERVTL